MARLVQRAPSREVRRTLLIVGEGLAEEAFLRHLKALYVERGSKVVTIKNAKGKGGRHVLSYALGQRKAADYDQIAALLDTDKDWDDAQRARARREGVEVVEATPCLEALLLAVARRPVPPSTAECKREAERLFGRPAHDEQIYPRHLPREVLDVARPLVPALAQLFRLLLD